MSEDMKQLLISISANKYTCGKCKLKKQHSNAYPNDYACQLFGKLETKGDWREKLIIYRPLKCLDAQQKGVSVRISLKQKRVLRETAFIKGRYHDKLLRK